MFRHPKYYKELRKLRNKSDQAISPLAKPVAGRRAPGQGLKLQAASCQASSDKPQATSSDILEPRYKKTEEVFLGKGPRAFTMINVFLG